ncbi:MAG TPA: hypothetical protein VEF89_07140 [Solirubrobacteraceae bacterium]|nr:hypothetical protein [Solirubrobacteraceae bacterium]
MPAVVGVGVAGEVIVAERGTSVPQPIQVLLAAFAPAVTRVRSSMESASGSGSGSGVGDRRRRPFVL